MLNYRSRLTAALTIILAAATPAFAGMSGIEWLQKWQQLEKRQGSKVDAAASASANVDVRVVKTDIAGRMLTISHGAVKKIGMPAMTMTFPVADATHLKMLHKGDRVNIHVVNEGGTVKVVGFKMKH